MNARPDRKRSLFWTNGLFPLAGVDDEGRSGVFVQHFAPGRDTSAIRRKLAGFSSEYLTESLGVSADEMRLTIAAFRFGPET